MRQEGLLSQWDDAKGYGFITPTNGEAKVFVHIKSFELRAERPRLGEKLNFELGFDGQGKRRALRVRWVQRSVSRTQPKAANSFRSLGLVPGFAGLFLACHLMWPMPPGVWGGYMAMSLATFIVYAGDKRAARLGQWRVSERTLHGLALAGGWPGALLAQHILRHKSGKPAFRRMFFLTVGLNVLGFLALFTPLFKSWL
ncbi:DUF1294 domain-containing protein [Roseateles sp.]|uniref:DUF1294 domain-containing protein n=1 Tax=Roseateles sp. TaxID=1971397 RepID=UPI003BA5390F